MSNPWKVFYSYAHADQEGRNRLGTLLRPLVDQEKITEWHDRMIAPGTDWNGVIAHELDSADLILLLVSPDFLASEYCFGKEVTRAFARMAAREARVVPVLLRDCLWEESRLSELQMIPRGAQPVYSFEGPSREKAFADVAREIRSIVAGHPPALRTAPFESAPRIEEEKPLSLDLVRGQVQAYARLYERTRQRMVPSSERTRRMENVFMQMRSIATASHPLFDELVRSASPGDKLAAMAILQVFASQRAFDFLVQSIGSEKPFVGYQAAKALRFAVDVVDTSAYGALRSALDRAENALRSATKGFDTDRAKMLREAQHALRELTAALVPDGSSFD